MEAALSKALEAVAAALPQAEIACGVSASEFVARMAKKPEFFIVGVASGVVTGMVGIGGAMLQILGLSMLTNMEQKNIIGTSFAAGIPGQHDSQPQTRH